MLAATQSQAAYLPLKLAKIACKYLSLIEIRSKSLVSCRSFVVSLPPLGRNTSSQIARPPGMHHKRFSCNAILSAACEAAEAKFKRQ
jgi:hypothetical protein